MRTLRLVGLVVVALVVFGGPAWWVATVIESPLEEDKLVLPVLIEPSSATVRDERPATLAVMLGETPMGQFLAPQSGIVTAVRSEVGAQFRTGVHLLDIDGQSVFALVSAAPLFRPISSGVSGPDVVTVRDFLAELGLLKSSTEEPEKFDAELGRAVADFNVMRSSTADDPVFPLDAIVWAAEPFEIADIFVELGTGEFGLGASVVSGAPVVLSVDIQSGDVEPGNEAAYVFEADDLRISLPDLGNDLWSDELRGRAKMVSHGSPVVEGSIELAEERIVQAVPVTALITSRSGPCLIALPSDAVGSRSDWQSVDLLGTPTWASVKGGDIGRTFLRESLPPNVVVLANPRLEDQARCQ